MVSLWGSKTDDEPENAPRQNGDSSRPRPSAEPADERTRLLANHPPPVQDGYLSPDDPAVSNICPTMHFDRTCNRCNTSD